MRKLKFSLNLDKLPNYIWHSLCKVLWSGHSTHRVVLKLSSESLTTNLSCCGTQKGFRKFLFMVINNFTVKKVISSLRVRSLVVTTPVKVKVRSSPFLYIKGGWILVYFSGNQNQLIITLWTDSSSLSARCDFGTSSVPGVKISLSRTMPFFA